MRHYEIVMLVHPDRSNRADAICDQISEFVSKDKGKVHRREDIGRRALAYPIAGLHKAHYFLMNVECGQKAYDQIGDYLKFNEDVLRRLTVRCLAAEKGPSALLMQTRKDRERLAKGEAKEAQAGGETGAAPEAAASEEVETLNAAELNENEEIGETLADTASGSAPTDEHKPTQSSDEAN